jgi:signal transduction histidine kinase
MGRPARPSFGVAGFDLRQHGPIRLRGVRTISRHGLHHPLEQGLADEDAGGVGVSPAAAGGWPWLFIVLAFVVSGVALFLCGRWFTLLQGSRKESVAPATAAMQTAAPGAESTAEGRAEAAALSLVEALPGLSVLAARRNEGWSVLGLSAAARAQWPHAGAGTALEALAGLSPAARAALDPLAPGQSTSFDGWRLAMLPPATGDGGGARALLSQAVPAAGEGEIFGSTLSHDLRAPIRVVEGFTRIVKEDYGDRLDRVGNDHLDRVLGAAARMNLMIDALLTLARLSAQPLTRQPVDLSQLAHFVIDDLRRASPREVAVEIEPGLAASGDPTLLRLVLENLIGNAWKYTARTEQARIAVRAVADAEHAGRRAVAVADNGAGFDMRSADRLFSLFQRLHSASDFPGHGVGLASVRRIVRRHGGEIWAEGRPGQGATFTFTLG